MKTSKLDKTQKIEKEGKGGGPPPPPGGPPPGKQPKIVKNPNPEKEEKPDPLRPDKPGPDGPDGPPKPGEGGDGKPVEGTPKGPGGFKKAEPLGQGTLDRVREGMENAGDHEIGQTGNDPEGEPVEPVEPGGPDGPDGPDGPKIPGGKQQPAKRENRDWGKLEKDVDDANREAGQREVKKQEKEEKTDSKKTKGGNGVGGFRDRIKMEATSKTDWAAIMRTRLSLYSKEASKSLPYHRKFVGNKMLRSRITSKRPTRDTMPETNIIMDTSSSLSYAEMEVILAEMKKAIEGAKIKKVNIMLWNSQCYYWKSYHNVTGASFEGMKKDIDSHWHGGGNNVNEVYKRMKLEGWTKKFTIHLTDGWIKNHKTNSETKKLSSEALDPANTIFGIIFPDKSVSVDQYNEICDQFPGEKVPIFLDTNNFF